MRENQPSRTSYRVALSRAAHQLLDDPLIFRDPLALQIIGAKARGALEANPRRTERRRWARPLRALLAVRSHIAEEALARAVTGGARQYVVLGAGLDTLAYRNTNPALRVFEVDHPNTQGWKRERLREAKIAEPKNLTFVPVDFERQQLGVEMTRAGFAADQPTFVSWLGVTYYLERPAIWATLKWIGALKNSGVAFDYAEPVRTAWHRVLFWLFSLRVKAVGEPFRSFFEPADMALGLAEAGFSSVDDLAAQDINRRYFAGRADGFQVRGSPHVVVAWT